MKQEGRHIVRWSRLGSSLLSLLPLAAVVLAPARARADTVGAVAGLSSQGNTYTIDAAPAQMRVIFYTQTTFRVWLAPTGTFDDPAGNEIVIPLNPPAFSTQSMDAGDHYEISSGAVVLHIAKTPLLLSLHAADGTVVWSEETGLSWDGTNTTQTLAAEG
jgi:hypothetical protein